MLSVMTSSVTPVVGHFPAGEEFGDHADHLAALGEGAVGERAHQADAAAAIHKAHASAGHGAAEFGGGGVEDGIVAGLGAAEHGDGVNV